MWIPTDPRLAIAAGSGVVSRDPGEGAERVVCYYEGNLYGSEQMAGYADRVAIAAGRLLENYPTVAQGAFRLESLQLVGTYDPERGIVSLTGHGANERLAEWVGVEDAELDAELITRSSLRQDFARNVESYLRSEDPAVRQWARHQAERFGISL